MLYKINTEFKKYSTTEAAKDTIEDLKAHQEDITTLDLSMNTFAPVVFKEIAEIIKQMKNLKHIKMESIFDSLTFDEMTSVLGSLSSCLPRTLVSFELPSNAVSCNFPEEFGKFLSECPLTVLNLYDCGLGQEGLAKICKFLTKLENKKNLRILNISKNRINCIDKSFANIFSEFENIEEFRIRHNTIEEQSLSFFLKNITNENIKTLDLSDNYVVAECIPVLGDLFLRLNLKELVLYDTKMTSQELFDLISVFNTKRTSNLPGSMEDEKKEFTLDISSIGFEQEVVPLLIEFADKFAIKKMTVFENDCEDLNDLKESIESCGGILVEDEDDDLSEALDASVMEKLKNL